MDLGVIILLQIAALCYGIYSIEQGRPVWLVYNVDRVQLIRKNEILEASLQKALPQYQQTSWLKPQYVGVELAKDIQTRNDDTFAEAFGEFRLLKSQNVMYH